MDGFDEFLFSSDLVAVGQECLSRLISDVCAGLVSEPDPNVDG